MALYKAPLTSGQQYDGATAATGLFDPGKNGFTGSPRTQCLIRSLMFSSPGGPVNWTISIQDPESTAIPFLLLAGSGESVVLSDYMLPTDTAEKGPSYNILFATDALTADASLVIDYDFIGTTG